MKKALFLLLLPLFFLSGCGSGGGDTTAGGPAGDSLGGSSDGGSGGVIVSSAGNITVNFPAVTTAQAQRAVVDMSGTIRNRARLVVRQLELEETGYWTYRQECVPDPDPDAEEGAEVCQNDPDDPGTWVSTGSFEKELFKKIEDQPLLSDGSGSVSIAVPPGSGYTLEVLTYHRTQDPLLPTDTTKLIQYLLEYGKSGAEFAIVAGQSTDVTIGWVPLATLVLPADSNGITLPVLAGSTYEVSANKSTAVRENWYVRQTLDETELGEMDLADEWFLHEDPAAGGEAIVPDKDDKYGTGTLKLVAPVKNSSGVLSPEWPLWVQGQFFISSHLLLSTESAAWKKWTFGTSYAGELNPLGQITITP